MGDMGGRKKGREPAPAVDAVGSANTDAPSSGSRARRRKRKSRNRSVLRRLVYGVLVLALWLAIGAIATLAFVLSTLPPIQSLEVPKRPPTVEIAGLDGRPLARRGEMSGTDVLLKDLPAFVPKAFIAIEDRRFFSHFGIDPLGLARAVLANVARRGVSQGGSTISQQLAKNLFLTHERTVWRKLQELVLALWLERKFSKTEILELYLNRVYFGAGAYGVEAAAQRYFGKPAREVKLAEAAMLAGLVRSPSRLAPTRNPYRAETRAQRVLMSMSELGFISETAAKNALVQPARVVMRPGAASINYVADWIMDVLDDLVGRVEQDLIVETSIDPALQGTAEQALVDELALKGGKFEVSQGAIVAMTPEGAVRALIGGKNYADSQYNRAVAARRQPGSAFKPFVYLTAMERGLTPDTVREDKPIALKGWKPENYHHEYHGPVTLAQALALSLNTVAVRLTVEFGPTAVAKTAYRLGIASKLDPNPSLALGTSEVSLIELVSAYAPFANGGNAVDAHVVERVRTRTGKVLFARAPENLGRIIEARYVGMMNAMMHATLVMGTARGAQLPGWTAAGKTGTSQDFRDAWFIGYTSRLVTGVWLGNDDSSPMRKTTGGSLPVEIWTRIMKAAHRDIAIAGLPGLPGGASSALASAGAPIASPVGADPGRPQPIDRGIDGWFLERLFGRH
jgi:penicillin-binding protein 1A